MSRAAFLRLAGSRLAHVTAARNLESIRRRGLRTAHDLARNAGVDPKSLILREDRVRLPCGALLTHQRPIAQAMSAARAMLEGHDPESWAKQLDQRVFFWTARHSAAFQTSIARETDTALIWLDAGGLYDRYADRLDLSPGNSGNFRQGGARMRRGDWLYVPATRSEDFPDNRTRRGLVKGRDTVREVSLRGSIPADILLQTLSK